VVGLVEVIELLFGGGSAREERFEAFLLPS
jgi:hypothetical protein